MMIPCKICGGSTSLLGNKVGRFIPDTFHFLRCRSCEFIFVANPITDYNKIYNDAYYSGKGADPLVDYKFELENASASIRNLEWEGIFDWAAHELRGAAKPLRWLDFGAGAGGLVRFLRDKGIDAVGVDVGSFVERAQRAGIPIYEPSSLKAVEAFDIVSMVEVIEHAIDPVGLLREASKHLKPNGRLILTTGNSEPFRHSFLKWSYVTPEIHVSYFNPKALSLALVEAEMRARPGRFQPGWDKIVAFKVLKNLRLQKINPLLRFLPWSLLSRLVDVRYQLSKHPVGIKDVALPS